MVQACASTVLNMHLDGRFVLRGRRQRSKCQLPSIHVHQMRLSKLRSIVSALQSYNYDAILPGLNLDYHSLTLAVGQFRLIAHCLLAPALNPTSVGFSANPFIHSSSQHHYFLPRTLIQGRRRH